MPQMAPYNWINLFLMFNTLFMISVTYSHFMWKCPSKIHKIIVVKIFKFTLMW